MDENRSNLRFSHISLHCLGRMLWHNAWMIVATALVFFLAVSLCLTWFHVPEYQANMTYAVNSRTTSYTSAGNLTSTREVASVLKEMLTTDLMDESIRSYDPRLENFDGKISATQVGDTNFLVVTVTASTPETAFLALQAMQELFPTIADFISNRNILIVTDDPAVSSVPSNRLDVDRLSKLAAILGAALMVAVLCYTSVKDETIQTRTGARELLDAPIIASICHEKKNRTLKTMLRRTNRQVKVFSPTTSFIYTEQIGSVCTQIEHEATAHGKKVFLVTGVGESEGKSTVAANVAAALALKGHNVALLDCDLRKPAMHRFFGCVYNSPLPLNKLLAQPYSLDNVRKCMVRNEQLGLYMLFPVNSDSASSELLSGNTTPKLIQQMRVFDYVIVDSPPMGMFPDAEILADMVDAVMLVVRQDYTAACDINDAIDTLRKYKCSFMGCILNDMLGSARWQYGYGGRHGSKYGYGHYGYGYGYRYGAKEQSGSES